ncbi:MAG: UDP-3-O-acyl-N-acetylglucosamine deacetylase [Verrucomicrobiota bacterium]|nr:UDP-3-O-acyl-N-acetylglucosamine deacetylase [Verrucomicrobiota bacterium]
MPEKLYGKVLVGSEDVVRRAYEQLARQPVDLDLTADDADDFDARQTTLGKSVSVTGPGTFFGRMRRALTFDPSPYPGWWLGRTDLPDSLPIPVAVHNVWTAARNIVLHCGAPRNYMRMVEHIVALKVGLGLDDVLIKADSGDPPLFDRGSMDLVEAVEQAGIVVSRQKPAAYVTVKEPVTAAAPNGGFLTILPAEGNSRRLVVDCAVDFPSVIGGQRIVFPVTRRHFRRGALARTNTTVSMMIYVKTIGRIFADTRNLGYTPANILVAGRRKYYNEPKLLHNGKSLEAVWHRSCLDLLAAAALINRVRLAGRIISYKSGHVLDCQMVAKLYQLNLLRKMWSPADDAHSDTSPHLRL